MFDVCFYFKFNRFSSLIITNFEDFLQAGLSFLVIENEFYCPMQCHNFAYQFLLQAATEALVENSRSSHHGV